METFELRYFLQVARKENVHRASDDLKVSPASLSKAIARLESELGVKLFERNGRGIRLTPQGIHLKERASQILELEASTRIELQGDLGKLMVAIAGPEVLMMEFGVSFSKAIKDHFPNSQFNYIVCDDEIALQKVLSREAHFALTSFDVSEKYQTKNLGVSEFVTVAGARHPLITNKKKSQSFKTEELLEFPFVSPSDHVLGKVNQKQSFDGWRDDKFPRIIDYTASNLKIMEQIISHNMALAYLPSYIAKPYLESGAWVNLKIVDCPYRCLQKIKIVTRKPIELGWINQIL